MENKMLNQNLVNELSDSNKRVSYDRNKTLLIMVVLLLSSLVFSILALIFSMQRIFIPGQTGTTGQPGTTGQTGQTGQAGQTGTTGQSGTTGQAGPAGATGTGGSLFTSGYHEEIVCIRANGQFDVFKSTRGGTGTCPSGDSEVVLAVKN